MKIILIFAVLIAVASCTLPPIFRGGRPYGYRFGGFRSYIPRPYGFRFGGDGYGYGGDGYGYGGDDYGYGGDDYGYGGYRDYDDDYYGYYRGFGRRPIYRYRPSYGYRSYYGRKYY